MENFCKDTEGQTTQDQNPVKRNSAKQRTTILTQYSQWNCHTNFTLLYILLIIYIIHNPVSTTLEVIC